MGNIPLIFSIVFSIACTISIFLGVYILYINRHAATNRIFFALSIALGFWAFGFSIAISAPDLSVCLFWRRISAIGWAGFSSILLHFILALTGKTNYLKKWWVYILLYAPSAISLAAFGPFVQINPVQYNMVHTALGWVNVSQNTGWDWFHTVYYISYTLFGFWLVWRWGRLSKEASVKRQSRIMVFSFVFSMLAGSVSDLFCNSIFSVEFPQIGPLIMLIPLAAVYYLIRKCSLMMPQSSENSEIIVKERIRTKMFFYLSYACIAGGLLNFVSQYIFYKNAELVHVLLFSLALIILGIFFQAVQKSKLKIITKDVLNALAISLVIPLITLRFIDFASVTVWAFPMIFLIFSLIFSKRYILIGVSVSTMITQIVVWILKPEVRLTIDSVDYVARIGIFAIAIGFAFYVNRVFISKINENSVQVKHQKLITAISSDYVTVNEDNLDQKNKRVLWIIGEYFDLTGAYIYLLDKKGNFSFAHSWPAENYFAQEITEAAFPWLTGKLQAASPVYTPDIGLLPPDACSEIERLCGRVRTFAAYPISSKGNILGFLGLESQKPKAFPDSQTDILKIISNILADAIEKVQQEKAINHMAFYDDLTGLPNRTLFIDRLTQSIELSKRTNTTTAVMFLDLNSYKPINDSLGHNGGDEYLLKVSEALTKIMRKSDAVSRFGGDVFLIMMGNMVSVKDIENLAEKIMSFFRKPLLLKNQEEFFISVSAGISIYPSDGEDAEALIKNADIAMSKSREKGGNCCILCSPDMKDEILTKIRLTNNLYRAIERNELILHYQPQVSLRDHSIIGMEALVRWQHPDLGMVPPNKFIPLAEHSGLINPIGEWVMRTACRQNKAWQDAGLPKIRMSVNVSLNQFRNPNFVGLVEKVLAETGLPPEYLELEITENIAIQESNYILSILNDLKKLGVLISIDDFGTEYSSLSRLKLLPIDRLKMDIQFVHGIDGDEKDRAITKIIINLAQNLGLKVIAEGVENENQLEFLTQKMCDEVQGFYYYRPMPAEFAMQVLKENPACKV